MTESLATSIQIAAADWLLERREGEWDETRQAELEAWMAQSLAHRIAYWRLDAAWSRADLLAAMRKPAFQRPRAPQRKVWPLAFRASAAVLLVAALAGAVQFSDFGTAPAIKAYTTAIGERQKLTLADGSQIELNTDTSLRARITARERRIWIDRGEVYFDVRHSESKPFIVTAGDHRLVDIGTKFLVRRDPSALKVAVLDGVVRLEDSRKRHAPEILTRGEVAVATATSTSVTRETRRALSDAIGWQRGVLVFDHTSLADAAREFNRYSTTRIVIADSKTAALTIDGTFPSNNVRAFARLAEAVLGLSVIDRGNEIVIAK